MIFPESSAPPTPKTPEELEKERQCREEAIRLQQQREREREEAREAALTTWRSKYAGYLRSKKWKRVRAKVLESADHQCNRCGRPATHVHHRKYPPGHLAGKFTRENYSQLEALCAGCHMNEHGIG